MIRINLLPQAKKAAKLPKAAPAGSSQLWSIIYLVAIVLWGAGLAAVYVVYGTILDEQKQRNATLQAQIEELEEKSAGLDEVRAKLEASRRLEEVVQRLQEARLGPTRVVMELSKILTPGKGPTIDPEELEELRRDNPLAGFNRSWDPRRLWLTSFTEENRECRITGRGKSNEDVAEFLRRLALSEVFEKVTLTKTQATTDQETGLGFIGFELTCEVTY